MFDTLLESNSKHQRVIGGTVASVVAHAGVIATAVFGTAQVPVREAPRLDGVRRIYFPPAPLVVSISASLAPPHTVVKRLVMPVVHTKAPILKVAQVEIGDLISAPPARSQAPVLVADDQGGNATRVTDVADEFPPDQVDRQAALLSGTSALTYPEPLRRSRVGGQVVAIFIVETDGHVEADSVHVARSDNALFEEVVLTALQRMRFSPAEIRGRKVRQLVQMPFVFAIRK